MSLLKLGFGLFVGMSRDLSARDLDVRLPVTPGNARDVISQLRARGVIERSFRQGREQFYRVVPGAALSDERTEFALGLNSRRRKKTILAKARTMRRVRG